MTSDCQPSLDIVRKISEKFVGNIYKDEIALFDTFWNMLSPQIARRIQAGTTAKISNNSQLTNPSDLYFAQGQSFNLVTPIVIATVDATVLNMQSKKLSGKSMNDFISQIATSFGATKELTASLTKHLPKFCEAVLKDFASPSSVISDCSNDRFRIWTNGKTDIVGNIDKFKSDKTKYLFFLDMNQPSHISPKNKSASIGPTAVNILQILVENLGKRVPSKEFIGNVANNTSDIKQASDKIEQQLTKLHKFSGGKFREYLLGNWLKSGLGLKEDFADKYFLYSRIRPDEE